MEVGNTNFRRFAPKSATIATSLERSWKGRIDYANPYVAYIAYLSWKFCEDRSSTFWDNRSARGPL